MLIKDIVKSIALETSFYKDISQKKIFYFFRFSMLVLFLYSMCFAFIDVRKNKNKDKPSPITLVRSYFAGKIPPIAVNEGIVSCPIKQPYLSPRIRNFQVLIDTTGTIKDLKENIPSGLLISRTYFLLKLNYKKKYPIAAYQLNKLLGKNRVYIDDQILESLAPTINMFLWPIQLTSSSWRQTWMNFLLLLCVSVMVFFIMQFYKIKLPFKHILKMATVALAPGLCLSIVLYSLSIPENFCMLLQFLFMTIALSVISKKHKEFR